MILPQDALTLAFTKLKTRRIRLVVTVVISGLLFVLLTLTSMIVNGALRSVELFSEEGFGKRYIVQVYPYYSDYYIELSKPENIAKAKAQLEELKNQKKAEAKRLNVEYDATSEQPVVIPNGSPDGGDIIDTNSPVGAKIMNDIIAAQGFQNKNEIKAVLDQYPIRETYTSLMFGGPYSMYGAPTDDSYSLIPLKDGKEFEAQGMPDMGTKGISTLANGMTIMSDGLLAPFILDGQSAESVQGHVAVLAPYDAAEEILGLTPLGINATSEQKLNRIKEVRQNIAGKTFDVCLRNKASLSRQEQAKQQAAEIEQNKNTKNYQLPDLIYSTQSTVCSDVVVTRDKRDADTKSYALRQEQFDVVFGKVLPAQRIVTFRVVGITSPQPDFQGFKVTDLISGLLTSTIGSGWFMPASQSVLLPEYDSAIKAYREGTDQNALSYVEFSNADDARNFVKERTCEPQFTMVSTNDPYAECREKGLLALSSFGSNSLAMDEFKRSFSKIFNRALLVISLISAIILMGTVGKIINDSRRETAVFRAIGAKRLDIAQIYITYTLLISAAISVFAFFTAYFLAKIIENRYAEDFTVQALVSFNARDLDRKFSLVGIDRYQVGMVIGIIIVGSLLSAALPLITNLRRNPIKDMRDER